MIRITLMVIFSAMFLSTGAVAQELLVSENQVRSEAEASLPAWWELTDFEIADFGGAELAVRSTGKVPGPQPLVPLAPVAPLDTPDTGKPGAGNAPLTTEQVVVFSATLRLTEELYEPLYSMDGAAFLSAVMGPGLSLDVTGTIGVAGSGDEAQFSSVFLNQNGLDTIGKPMTEFDQPAFIEGSDEGEAYLEAAAIARAEGTMNKLMSDEGEEL